MSLRTVEGVSRSVQQGPGLRFGVWFDLFSGPAEVGGGIEKDEKEMSGRCRGREQRKRTYERQEAPVWHLSLKRLLLSITSLRRGRVAA